MRKGVKISLCLVLSGMMLIGMGGAMMGFDLTKLDTATYIERNEIVNEPFTEVVIDCDAADVTVLPSPDGVCRVESKVNRDFEYSMTVEDGKLRICYEAGVWYRHLHVHLVKTYITVYLPEKQYKGLKIDLISGDVVVKDLQIEKSEIETISGDVKVNDWNGDLLDIETTSGDVELKNCSTDTLSVETVSGDLEIEDLVAKGAITLDCTSGDIEFERMDGAELRIETVSGDVEGSLLSNKHFIAKSTSGDIDIPDSDSSAGKCIAKTTSGDIKITVIK